ncbi:MAG TPA: PAS domain S-box protein [Mycobacteriales bacterium]|nr:PAS domain S-box protein [Mycobacteriales bacterium]
MSRRADRRASAGLLVTAMTCLLVVVVAVAGGLMFRSEDAQRDAAVDGVDARRVTAAAFVESYVAEVFQRERILAGRTLAAPVSAATFEAISQDHGFAAAVLLDEQGRVLASEPANPAALGMDVRARYDHLRSAAAGIPAVSGVVPSVGRQEPVIGFAVPFQTTRGTQVFSGAYQVKDTPLSAFVRNAAPFRTGEVLLVDGTGRIVAGSGDSAGDDLAVRYPELAGRAGRSGFVERGGREHYVSQGAVEGTSWQLVYSVDTQELYAPLNGPGRAVKWFTLLALALTGTFALVALMRQLRIGQAVTDSEALRRAVLDTANDAYIAMDADGTILDWNAAAEALLGWPAGQAVGSRLSELLIPPEQRARHDLGLRRFLDTGHATLPDGPVPLQALRSDGTRVSVELSLSRMRWGTSWRFHAFLRDTTARLQRQAELQRSEEMFRSAFDDAIVGMCLTSPEGVFMRVNQTVATMLGYSREQLVGMSFADVSTRTTCP